MFDLFKNGSAAKGRSALSRLESLEDRSVPAVIGGVVYNDANANGTFQWGESAIPASTLSLFTQAGQQIATTTSDSTGHYQFTQRNIGSTGPETASHEAVFAEAQSGLTHSATVPQFDPSLGTLTSVEIQAEGSLKNHTVIESALGSASTVKMELEGSITYNAPGATAITAPITRTVEANVAAFDGQADLQGASSKDFGTQSISGQFNTVTITDPTALAAYTGTGTVAVGQTTDATECTCGPGNLLAMAQTTASGKAKVVYHYTPSTEIGPGTYKVVQSPQPGGYADGYDTSDNVTPIPGSNTTDTITVTINTTTDQSTNNNFGERLVTTPTPVPVVTPTPVPVTTPLINIGLTKMFYFGGAL